MEQHKAIRMLPAFIKSFSTMKTTYKISESKVERERELELDLLTDYLASFPFDW